MKTADLRAAYLAFFEERGHRVVPSSPLVPRNDPTLLFTNAGMLQFKDALLGLEDRGYQRAASAQRCVRAGGKHNDLDNVGYTARHHTLFEMLGNFSFGDYFKEATIAWAWEFITNVLELPPDRLWVTVHPTDDEARALWRDAIGFPSERIVSLEENFWAMGDTGPCGPCSEVFYDHGEHIPGGPPGSAEEDGDRFVEFWNLVFPQFDRSAEGELTPLKSPGVDTGMGLERTAAIMQGVSDNYDIDIFRSLVRAAADVAGVPRDRMRDIPSLKVIADHIRSCAFLIADGVAPGNEDRSYVLRRIIRRALRHGHKLGVRDPFFHELVEPLAAEMGAAYPIIREQQDHVTRLLLREEERFAETLAQGMELLNRTIDRLDGDVIPGDVVFRLYDTYGFPADLTADVARERNLGVDMAGFEAGMAQQRKRARAASRFEAGIEQQVRIEGAVTFVGYEGLIGDGRVIAAYRRDGDRLERVEQLNAGERGVVVLDATPFYAEAGGQVGDVGTLTGRDGIFDVDDTTGGGDQHLHHGTVRSGSIAVGAGLTAEVRGDLRRRTAANHSATHLLHAALREVLGTHVKQKGSLVSPTRLRFDFSHPATVDKEQLERIEQRVNEEIQRNTPAAIEQLPYDDAIAKGAMALFGEKYDDEVRVLTMGDGYSVELCGGTHVGRTGDIGVFRVVSESGIAAGIRRIEAVAGPSALDWIDRNEELLEAILGELRSSRDDALVRLRQLKDQERDLARRLEQANARLASREGTDLVSQARSVDGVKVLAARLDGMDGKTMLSTLDTLKAQLGSAVVVLGQVQNERVSLIAGVTRDLTDRVKAGDVINVVARQVGARGGGRPDMARAGGGDRPEQLNAALAAVEGWVAERL